MIEQKSKSHLGASSGEMSHLSFLVINAVKAQRRLRNPVLRTDGLIWIVLRTCLSFGLEPEKKGQYSLRLLTANLCGQSFGPGARSEATGRIEAARLRRRGAIRQVRSPQSAGFIRSPTSGVRRAKERSRVRSPQDSYPESGGFIRRTIRN